MFDSNSLCADPEADAAVPSRFLPVILCLRVPQPVIKPVQLTIPPNIPLPAHIMSVVKK